MAASHRGRDRDIHVRTSWLDANLALAQYKKGRIGGDKTALWARAKLQDRLEALGGVIHRHAGKILFVAVLLLTTFCVGLKSAQLHTRVDQLWVQEGGRLESELAYIQSKLDGSNGMHDGNEEGGSNSNVGGGTAATHQLFMQVAKDPTVSPLSAKALLGHLESIRKASKVAVYLYDQTWELGQLCQKPSVPNFEKFIIEQIFNTVIPCTIATPLDCFWEGSKLMGPEHHVFVPGINDTLNWTHLNPSKIVAKVKEGNPNFPFSILEGYMKRAGISSGYQEKPCLDPTDPLCPSTASNKMSQQIPDVGAELSGGCYGFAAKYMHWPEELLVGGGEHNKTGHLQKARALQSVIHLMTERELYESFKDDYRVHQIGWSQKKASNILDAWQRKFSEEIKKQLREEDKHASYEFYAFSTVALNDILSKYTNISMSTLTMGYIGVMLYVVLVMFNGKDYVKSQIGIGVAGVVLLTVTVVAGLGFCALLAIPFNASTTQIIPFMAIGLGVNDIFLLTHSYAAVECNERDIHDCVIKTPMVLRTTGLSVLQVSLAIISSFCAITLLPIPALRMFAIQCAILMVFNMASILLVFPAMISLDLRRRAAHRSDIFCCIIPEKKMSRKKKLKHVKKVKKVQAVTKALPPDRLHTVTSLLDKELLDPESLSVHSQKSMCEVMSLQRFVRDYYAPFLAKPCVKVITMILFVVVLIVSCYGAMKMTDGLNLTDIVPQDTDEYKFLDIQGKHFGFYSMFAVTQGNFEYPTNQKLLYEYHDAFVRIPSIIKNDNGGLPEFWLSLFRDWLIELQKAFDRDYKLGSITQETWYANASNEGILAYKLLVQTGHVDNPIDKSQVSFVKLVDSEGIINPKAFYNYLSAWATNDALAYGASAANLRPVPREWQWSSEYELKIPKSAPLTYAQMPFYLRGMNDTNNIKILLTDIRSLCAKFEAKGLTNFPSGILFIFWEQYLGLRQSLALALFSAFGVVLVIVGLLLLNPWAALQVVFFVILMVLQLIGAMGLLGIKLCAVSASLIIMAVGIEVHFLAHIAVSFITSVGSRDRRIALALEHMIVPVFHGGMTTLISVSMLALSDFSFIVNYYFTILMLIVIIGFLNGLLFFPVFVGICGPLAEVISIDHPDRVSTPSPASSPVRVRRNPPPVSHHRPRPPSLTTITEEPSSCHSSHSHHSSMQSIVVQPEVVVETTYNTEGNSGSGSSTPTVSSSVSGITTKVTAMANIKVEVHTPMLSVDRYSRRYCRDRDRDRSRDRDKDYHERDRDRDRDSYYERGREYYHDRDRDRDSRERDKDRDRSRESDKDNYREQRRERERNRDRHRDTRDSGHESDTSKH